MERSVQVALKHGTDFVTRHATTPQPFGTEWLTEHKKTKHAQDFIVNPNVAGSIALETKEVSKIQGVQLLGTILELKEEELKITKKQYLKAFPYARLMKLHLWAMQLTFIKMTHNRLGFGKKLLWEK